jgi:hypothetical protein
MTPEQRAAERERRVRAAPDAAARKLILSEVRTGELGRPDAPVERSLWATPRTTNSACHTLTLRGLSDVSTQVRFEASTPDEDRGGVASAEFLEFLMGYPISYTKV